MAFEDTAVRREVVFAVDRETVWAALTDPEELAAWLGEEVELRIEPGAEGWIRGEDGERRPVSVEELVEGRRIVLRWTEPGPAGPETVVELVLDDVAEGTRLVVVELPVAELQAVGLLLQQGPPVIGGPGLGAQTGPQMVAALA